jgi:Mg2+/Co2+ transporter CorC
VRDIFTPRAELTAFQQDQTVDEVNKGDKPSALFAYSCIRARSGRLFPATCCGIRCCRHLRAEKGQKPSRPWPPSFNAVPLPPTAASVLDQFIRRREHIFLVVDEYGGTAGIITLEDAIETFAGGGNRR